MRALTAKTAYRNAVLNKCKWAKLHFNTSDLPPPQPTDIQILSFKFNAGLSSGA